MSIFNNAALQKEWITETWRTKLEFLMDLQTHGMLEMFLQRRTLGGRTTIVNATEMKSLMDVTPQRAVEFTAGGQLIVYPNWPSRTSFVLSITMNDKKFLLELIGRSKVFWTPNLTSLLESYGVSKIDIERLKTLQQLKK